MAHVESAGLFLGVIVGLTGFVYWQDRKGSKHRLAARMSRLHGRRGGVVSGALLLATAGVSFLVAYYLVRFPGPRDTVKDDQPVPEWPWQLGLGLLVLGAVGVALMVVFAPRPVVNEPPRKQWEPSHRIMSVMIVVTGALPMLVTAAASLRSQLAYVPVVMAIAMTVGAFIWPRYA